MRITPSLWLAGLCAAAMPLVTSAALPDIRLETWAKGFDHPVWITPEGPKGDALLVVEQAGQVRRQPGAGGEKGPVIFDIRSRVNYGGEKGLLSLVFHPQWTKNGKVYVNYTAGKTDGELTTRISEFRYTEDRQRIDPDSERIVLEFKQPYANHNGGLIQFGPDGYLYIGNGDGGAANDPKNNGQQLNTLLGKILRIDVNRTEGDRAYAIPADNPFVGQDKARPEIYAYGLRNPWRWSFDRKTGDLLAGDVGQNNWEEVDLIEKGKNYGWRTMEGFHCTPKIGENCDQTGLVLPLVEYPHNEGVSITGGYVYRGRQFPSLQGIYFYADYGSRRVWSLRQEKGRVQEMRELMQAPQPVSSFGEDREGELFVVGYQGEIYRLQPR